MKDRHSSGGLPVEEIADTGQSTCTDGDCLYTSSDAYVLLTMYTCSK